MHCWRLPRPSGPASGKAGSSNFYLSSASARSAFVYTHMTQLPVFSSSYACPYFYEYKSISNSVSVSRGTFQSHRGRDMRAKTSRTAQPELPQAGRSWPMSVSVRDDVPQSLSLSFAAGGAEFPSSPTFQISNRQFLVRLETSVTPRKQRAGVNSNRHFSEGMVRGNCVLPCIGDLLFLAGSHISNRLHLRLENVPNSNKRKALREF
jgi:hypothetical protein